MPFHCRPVLAAACLSLSLSLPPGAAAAGPGSPPAGDAVAAQRPKICLVLSGGGARGAAHVGVLKVLEEYRVPVDCIAGTSMGALVGAAYATGTSLAEMEGIIAGISTELLFKEKPPREERSMRRKYDDYELFFGPEIGVGSGELWLSKGLVTGVQLETVLRQLSKAKGFHDFDRLPIPYRAVATDLVTGKAVVFSQGELANVMRASMSVPGAVAPAEFDNMVLVDGMLTANLPVEVARSMGADVIIAVNVGTPLLKKEQLNGILGVTSQMLNILTEQNVQASLAQLRPTDIVITPELGDFGTADFDSLLKIQPLGEAAARRVAQRLERLSIPAAQYAALRKRQLVAVLPDTRPVDEIRIEGLARVNPLAVRAAMDTKPGEPLDQKTLDRDMLRVYGTGSFEHTSYGFLEEPGRRILVVNAVEKSWGQDYVRFGLGLSTDFSRDAYFNVVGSFRRYWLNSLGAEWRTDLQFGRTSSLLSEFYQPVNPEGRLFIAPRLLFERRKADLYDAHRAVASYGISTSSFGVDIGSLLGRYGEARVGLVRGTERPRLDVGPEFLTPGEPRIAIGAARAALLLDQVDSIHFPRSGWRGGLRIFKSSRTLGAGQEYAKWDLDGGGVVSFGGHTFSLAGKFGGRIGADPLPRYDLFQWGGFLQQSGYSTGQLLGETLKFGRLMYYHRILRGSFLEGAYAGASLELGRLGRPLVPGSPEGLLKSGSVFLGADSPVGPVYLGYGRAADGNGSLYFYLGRPF